MKTKLKKGGSLRQQTSKLWIQEIKRVSTATVVIVAGDGKYEHEWLELHDDGGSPRSLESQSEERGKPNIAVG